MDLAEGKTFVGASVGAFVRTFVEGNFVRAFVGNSVGAFVEAFVGTFVVEEVGGHLVFAIVNVTRNDVSYRPTCPALSSAMYSTSEFSS